MRCELWSVLLTGGEYCIAVILRNVGWGLDSSLMCFFVSCGLTGSGSWVAESSWGGDAGADVVRVGLRRGRDVEKKERNKSLTKRTC